MTIYDGSARELACDLFDRGLGYRVVAGRMPMVSRISMTGQIDGEAEICGGADVVGWVEIGASLVRRRILLLWDALYCRREPCSIATEKDRPIAECARWRPYRAQRMNELDEVEFMLLIEAVELLRVMGELVGEDGEDVEIRARPSQRRDGVKDAGHGALAARVRSQPVVHLGVAVDGDAYEEVMLSEKCRPGVVDNVAVRLNGEVDRLPGAVLVDVGAERPEEIESRTRGFAALERKGHLGIVSKPKSAVDDCLIGCCIHDAMFGVSRCSATSA